MLCYLNKSTHMMHVTMLLVFQINALDVTHFFLIRNQGWTQVL